MPVIQWIWTNREWVFSGIGVVVLAAILRFVWHRIANDTKQPDVLAEPPFIAPTGTSAARPSQWWSFLERIPGLQRLARKRLYTSDAIARRVRIWVRGEGDGMSFWKLGEHGKLEVWLDVVNLNPFPLTIDRITGHATVAGSAVASVQSVDQHEVAATATQDVHVSFPLAEADIQQIAFQLKQQTDAAAGLNIRLYMLSEIRKLTLDRQLSTGNRRFLNFQLPETPSQRAMSAGTRKPTFTKVDLPVPPLGDLPDLRARFRPLANQESSLKLDQLPNNIRGLVSVIFLQRNPQMLSARRRGGFDFQYVEVFKDANSVAFARLWIPATASAKYDEFLRDSHQGKLQLVTYTEKWTEASVLANIPLALLEGCDLEWLNEESNARLVLRLEKTLEAGSVHS
jgi:hypothetical protein